VKPGEASRAGQSHSRIPRVDTDLEGEVGRGGVVQGSVEGLDGGHGEVQLGRGVGEVGEGNGEVAPRSHQLAYNLLNSQHIKFLFI